MSNSGKNVIMALGVVTIVFAGYYVYTSQSSPVSESTDSQLAEMLQKTQQFTQHQQVLNAVTLETSFLQTPEFRSLRSFSPEPAEFQVGRSNPFLPPGMTQTNNLTTP